MELHEIEKTRVSRKMCNLQFLTYPFIFTAYFFVLVQ